MTQPQSTAPKSALTDTELRMIYVGAQSGIAQGAYISGLRAAAAVAADRAQHPKCGCGNPMELGIVHRVNRPCWVAQQK